MKPFAQEQFGALTSALIKQCLDLAAEIALPISDLATYCGTSRATLYRWQKELKEGRLVDPEGSAPAVAFMNLLIFRVYATKEINDGNLPFDGRKGARKFIRQLAPEVFDSDAS